MTKTKTQNGGAMLEVIPIRASSLPELMDCPARWEAKHILKIPRPTSMAAQLGTAVHAGTALFDQCRMEGNPISVDEAAGAVVDALQHPDTEVDWEDENPASIEKRAIPLHALYCKEIAPRQDYVAVEALAEDLTISDLGITLTGTIDRVRVTKDGSYGIADIKTGKSAVAADGTVKTSSHAAQLAVYELLASHALDTDFEAPAQIIGLQDAKTDKGRRAAIGEIYNPKNLLLDDEETGRAGLLRIASRIVHNGDFYGNTRSNLCTEKYCPIFNNCRWRR